MNVARPDRRSQAGNALSVWLILFAILTAGMALMWYFAQADISSMQDDLTAANVAKAAETQKLESRLESLTELYKVVGFRGDTLAMDESAIESSAAAITAKLTTLKAELGAALGSADTDVTLEEAVAKLQERLASQATAIGAAEADVEKEIAARTAATSATRRIEDDYKTQLAAATANIRELQDSLDSTEGRLTDRIDELLADDSTRSDQMRQLEDERDAIELQAKKNMSNAQATIAALETKREKVEPAAMDGEIMSVTGSGALAYIDIGKRDGLKRGTRFEMLRRGKGGAFEPRGWLEVEDVEKDMALCRMLNVVDPFDPMLPGDVVRNPHFEKGMSLHYFLHGEFPLNASREYISQQLGARGASVDESLSVVTDVLVLGAKNMADEFAPELTESDEYKLASELGVRVMRLDDLLPFLAF